MSYDRTSKKTDITTLCTLDTCYYRGNVKRTFEIIKQKTINVSTKFDNV